MTLLQIFLGVQEILAKKTGIDSVEILRESRLGEDLRLDRLDMVEVRESIEKKFGCSIPDSDMDSIKTVENIVVYIKRKGRV